MSQRGGYASTMPLETKLFSYCMLALRESYIQSVEMPYSQEVFLVSKAVKVPPTEWYGTKILRNSIQQTPG